MYWKLVQWYRFLLKHCPYCGIKLKDSAEYGEVCCSCEDFKDQKMKFNFNFGEVYKTREGKLVTVTHETFIIGDKVLKVFCDNGARYSNGQIFENMEDPRDVVSGPIKV